MLRTIRNAFVALVVAACNDENGSSDGSSSSGPAPEPAFPADYETRYTEVRPCMPSGDHDLNNVRILVDDAAREPYEGRMLAFPVDSVVLKAEYDFGDTTCADAPTQWTVMRKLMDGSAEATLDWAWQTVTADRVVEDIDEPRCISCHTGCGVPPDGYGWTCAIPQ